MARQIAENIVDRLTTKQLLAYSRRHHSAIIAEVCRNLGFADVTAVLDEIDRLVW